jgi:hypothetical protein
MRDWELAAVAGVAAVALYLWIERNPQIKQNISNIIPSPTPPPSYIPISTTLTAPDLSKPLFCPPGMYLDKTDGIYRCHSARTHGLNPNVKLFDSQLQRAWGSSGYGSVKYVDNTGYWGNSRYTGYGTSQSQKDVKALEDLTQTILPPTQKAISKTEAQQKRQQRRERKVDEKKIEETLNPDIPPSIARTVLPPTSRQISKTEKTDDVRIQIECPSDLRDISCGSECYHDGAVMRVECKNDKRTLKQIHRAPKAPSRSELPYPISPDQTGDTDQPYPETEVGGSTDQLDVTPLNNPPLAPDQQQISPTEPDTSGVISTPPTRLPQRQPEIGTIVKEPTRQPQIGHVTTPSGNGISLTPLTGTYKAHKSPCLTSDQTITNGCYHGCVSEGVRDTCRYEIDARQYYNQDYTIDARVHLGQPTKLPGRGGNNPYTEITSGGPGSSSGTCCGFTAGIRNNDGYLHMEAEGAAKTEEVYCDDKTGKPRPCTQERKSITGGARLYGQKVRLQWIKKNGVYGAAASGPSGSIPFTPCPVTPKVGLLSGKRSSDSTRVRTDGTDFTTTIDAKLYPNNSYYSNMGYIDNQPSYQRHFYGRYGYIDSD